MSRLYKGVKIEPDEDGWWGYCPDGLRNSEEGSHTFHEYTLSELKEKIRAYLEPCLCRECVKTLSGL